MKNYLSRDVCVCAYVCVRLQTHTVKYIISHYGNTFMFFRSSKQDRTFMIKYLTL